MNLLELILGLSVALMFYLLMSYPISMMTKESQKMEGRQSLQLLESGVRHIVKNPEKCSCIFGDSLNTASYGGAIFEEYDPSDPEALEDTKVRLEVIRGYPSTCSESSPILGQSNERLPGSDISVDSIELTDFFRVSDQYYRSHLTVTYEESSGVAKTRHFPIGLNVSETPSGPNRRFDILSCVVITAQEYPKEDYFEMRYVSDTELRFERVMSSSNPLKTTQLNDGSFRQTISAGNDLTCTLSECEDESGSYPSNGWWFSYFIENGPDQSFKPVISRNPPTQGPVVDGSSPAFRYLGAFHVFGGSVVKFKQHGNRFKYDTKIDHKEIQTGWTSAGSPNDYRSEYTTDRLPVTAGIVYFDMSYRYVTAPPDTSRSVRIHILSDDNVGANSTLTNGGVTMGPANFPHAAGYAASMMPVPVILESGYPRRFEVSLENVSAGEIVGNIYVRAWDDPYVKVYY